MRRPAPSLGEPTGRGHAACAWAVAGPGIATVLLMGLGWSIGLPAIPAALAAHACLLALLITGPGLMALAVQTAPGLPPRLLRHALLAVTVLGGLALWRWSIPITLALPSLALAQGLVLTWLALPLLTTGGDGVTLMLGGAGLVVGLLTGAIGGSLGGDAGLLWGLAAGPALCAGVLHLRLRNRVADPVPLADEALPLLSGGVLATGLCGDALVAWRVDPAHGLCALVPQLAAVLILIVVLVRCGTAFRRGHARFRATMVHGGDLAAIMTAKQELVLALSREAALALRILVLVVLALVLCAPPLVRALGLPAAQVPQFCLEALGAALLVPVLAVMTLLLAGGWQRAALAMALSFGALALLAALPALGPLGIPSGWGRVIGAVAALAVGLNALRHHLTHLEYATLAREPLRA